MQTKHPGSHHPSDACSTGFSLINLQETLVSGLRVVLAVRWVSQAPPVMSVYGVVRPPRTAYGHQDDSKAAIRSLAVAFVCCPQTIALRLSGAFSLNKHWLFRLGG